MKFSSLDLMPEIQRAVDGEGYTSPTPIQEKSIPYLIEDRDLLGIAQTGTGKTAAFSLPLLQKLSEGDWAKPGAPRALILAPTRELAGQISDCIRTYGKYLNLRHAVVFGGTPIGKQIRALQAGVDILVATPGRLLDLMNRNHIRLGSVETFILDEADRMLDMGFIHDVRKVSAKLPNKLQTVFFSATMPASVGKLAATLLKDPIRVEVAPQATTAERIEQHVVFVAKEKKREALIHLLADPAIRRVLIFTRTKRGADKVARHLDQASINAGAIHGNKSQNARERALKGFKSGNLRALVATDIAARGIDVDGVTHVINFELPNDPENYVHRIGRTARAGASGKAISLCDGSERSYLRDIEKIIRQKIPALSEYPSITRMAENAGPAQGSEEPRHDERQHTEDQQRQKSRKPGKWNRNRSNASGNKGSGNGGNGGNNANRGNGGNNGANNGGNNGNGGQNAKPSNNRRRKPQRPHNSGGSQQAA